MSIERIEKKYLVFHSYQLPNVLQCFAKKQNRDSIFELTEKGMFPLLLGPVEKI